LHTQEIGIQEWAIYSLNNRWG